MVPSAGCHVFAHRSSHISTAVDIQDLGETQTRRCKYHIESQAGRIELPRTGQHRGVGIAAIACMLPYAYDPSCCPPG